MDITGDESFEELSKLADEGKLTQTDMEKVLQSYAAAVREEFKIATETDSENVVEAARDFGRKHSGEALAQIHLLMHSADSESVRFSASKYIMSLALDESRKDGDPIKAILNDLMKTDVEV